MKMFLILVLCILVMSPAAADEQDLRLPSAALEQDHEVVSQATFTRASTLGQR